ncbi:hypothetical protein BJY04DRAFT_168676 [Aspergillus karnatakaensis]|uniref:uncharacterized protein n=1 Tax=Aspergillus karnatakaensis TaxID=1810916 RepID=UPI003CCD0FED
MDALVCRDPMFSLVHCDSRRRPTVLRPELIRTEITSTRCATMLVVVCAVCLRSGTRGGQRAGPAGILGNKSETRTLQFLMKHQVLTKNENFQTVTSAVETVGPVPVPECQELTPPCFRSTAMLNNC